MIQFLTDILYTIKAKLNHRHSKIQTFTIFIPTSKARTSTYREKQFDQISYDVLNSGFKIMEIKTIPVTGENASGMWVIYLLRSKCKAAEELNLDKVYGTLDTRSDDGQLNGQSTLVDSNQIVLDDNFVIEVEEGPSI